MTAALVLLAAAARLAAPEALPPALLVVCSPGSTGEGAEAGAAVHALAAVLSDRTRVSLEAVKEPTEGGCAGALRSDAAALALLPLPLFLKLERPLGLRARLQAVRPTRPVLDRWALVARKGRVRAAADLEGFALVSTAGYAPAFVRGVVQRGLGAPPEATRVAHSAALLPALRRAAEGLRLAVLLDGPEQAVLASSPLASDLETVTRSAPVPAAILVEVGDRITPAESVALDGALRTLATEQAGAAVLVAIDVDRFVPLDEDALTSARAAYVAGGAR